MQTHIAAVEERAVRTALSPAIVPDVRVASLLHDLGKYTDKFGYRLDGALTTGLDHSSAGARAVLECYQSQAQAVALAIEGHHIGLQRPSGALADQIIHFDNGLNSPKSTGSDWRGMLTAFMADGFHLPHPTSYKSTINFTPGLEHSGAAEMVDVRMLFSTLVDADYIETEAHFEGDIEVKRRYRDSGPPLDAAAALQRVLEAAAEKRLAAEATPRLLRVRESLRESCLRAAQEPVGIFTLTAPTGAGKTLAMLAFALAHAVQHTQMRRIVIIIPYLTIIEQTAQLCRELLGGLGHMVVLEDHSVARTRQNAREAVPDNEDPIIRQQRLLAENWDAPIIITTSLNALESLHDNAPRRCRKLHHLANSVLLFDEVQTLPPHLAELTLATLSRLSHRFGTSVVFSTATQPAFDALDRTGVITKLCAKGWRPREIAGTDDECERLFDLAKDRYTVTWRLDQPIDWNYLAVELIERSAHRPVIVIVNIKRHAIALMEIIQQANVNRRLFHLSTNLCPRHRERVLAEVLPVLKAGQPMILIATQCIEAGVDISAPLVYRALAPLESIAQAAGRCNRHGTDPQPGRVVVFVPTNEAYPPGAYETASRHTKSFIAQLHKVDGIDPNQHNILSDPALLRRYYRQLYQAGIHESLKRAELLRAVEERDFPTVAHLYRLIDHDTVNVLVPYDNTFHTLVNQIEKKRKIDRDWVAKARPIAVGVRRPLPDDDAWASLRPLPDGTPAHETEWFAPAEQALESLYDRDVLGLVHLRRNWFAEPI